MADRIPTYIDQSTQRITELAVDDVLDVASVKATDVDVTNLTIGGDAYAPYDDSQLQADVATKLDADKIWTGTEAEYNSLSPDADTLYFITA
jgi:hypothetical protein